MQIFLKMDQEHLHAEDQESDKLRQEYQAERLMKVAAQLENTYFSDLVESWSIEFDPRDESSVIAEDAHWLSLKERFANSGSRQVRDSSPFVVRYVMSLQRMIEKEDADITLQIIAGLLGCGEEEQGHQI